MAYFERGDERDQLVFCNICNVKCAERSIIVHKGKCSDRHAKKFQSGDLIKCQYDSTHTVPEGQWDDHLEFCTKYQNKLLGVYQLACRAAVSDCPIVEPIRGPELDKPFVNNDEWSIDPNRETFTMKFDNMKL